jgi:uncharacterized caspase-like protein
MRKALIVGINHYNSGGIKDLNGCHSDAENIAKLLQFHHQGKQEDGEPNFSCKIMKSDEDEAKKITRPRLQSEIKALFEDEEADVALLYFSGHGYESSLGGYLVTQDAALYEEGVSFNDVMIYANNSSVKEIIIILDCCRSGSLGNVSIAKNGIVTLRKGISILTASTAEQNAFEKNGQGIFTQLICNALSGGNSDILGNVKLTHLYEHVEKMLGPWDQRPTFKSNSSRLTVLRKAEPKIPYDVLKKITSYFKGPKYYLPLDPSFEPSEKLGNKQNEEIFRHLQKFANVGLVTPINTEFMYYAAIESKHCALTEYGKQYWSLIAKESIL